MYIVYRWTHISRTGKLPARGPTLLMIAGETDSFASCEGETAAAGEQARSEITSAAVCRYYTELAFPPVYVIPVVVNAAGIACLTYTLDLIRRSATSQPLTGQSRARKSCGRPHRYGNHVTTLYAVYVEAPCQKARTTK